MLQDKVWLHSPATPLSADSEWVQVIKGGWYNWHARGTWNGAEAALLWADNSSGTGSAAIDGATLSADGASTGIPISAGWVKVDFTGTPTSVSSWLAGISD